MANYVIIDLEMCKVLNSEKKKTFGHTLELIQIGAVLLDSAFKQIDTFMTFVRPEFGVIDNYIKNLTGITPKDVRNAPSAAEAIEAFVDWLPKDAIIISWSMTDREQIRKEIKGKNIDVPEISFYYTSWLDCQESFSEKLHDSRKYNLKSALDICGVDYVEKQHDALADAINTGKLFKLIMECDGEISLSPYYIPAEYASSVIFDPFARKFGPDRAS